MTTANRQARADNSICHWDAQGELEGNTGKCEVVGSGHDKTKVTMAATAMSGRDGMCIGINFLGEEFD